MVVKHNKRCLDDEELYQVAHKHPRQLNYSSHLPSLVDFVPDVLDKPEYPDEVSLVKAHFEKRFGSDTLTELSVSDDESESNDHVNVSDLPSVTSNDSSVEENIMEPALELSRFPSFPGYGHQRREECQSQELCPHLLDYPFRKTVPVGPDHQADIPEYLPNAKGTSGYLHLPATASSVTCALQTGDDNTGLDNLTGSCMTPVLEASLESVGIGRINCSCRDKGSVRCVRQHVIEAREKLRAALGLQRFLDLGFYEMGEVVGKKWSEEEEHAFHEVVFSNPQSSGKNFWDELSLIFPTRSKMELVSYYFNVFMLRRRAEQNRVDSLNIDSDDDEWHGGDESESGTTDGEDSVMESPINQGILHNEVGESDFEEEDEIGDDDFDSADGDTAVEGGQHDSEGQISDESTQNKWFYGNLQDGLEDQNLQDESCTSSECLNATISGPDNGAANGGRSYQNNGALVQEQQAKMDSKRWSCDFMNGSLTDAVDHGYTLEPSHSKEWDSGFITSPLKDFDSLPAWHMIEDVFGDGTWTNSKMRDGPGFQ